MPVTNFPDVDLIDYYPVDIRRIQRDLACKFYWGFFAEVAATWLIKARALLYLPLQFLLVGTAMPWYNRTATMNMMVCVRSV